MTLCLANYVIPREGGGSTTYLWFASRSRMTRGVHTAFAGHDEVTCRRIKVKERWHNVALLLGCATRPAGISAIPRCAIPTSSEKTSFLVRLSAVSPSRPANPNAPAAACVKPGRRPPCSGAKRALRKPLPVPRLVRPGASSHPQSIATHPASFHAFQI
jgi:hypothetical protein